MKRGAGTFRSRRAAAPATAAVAALAILALCLDGCAYLGRQATIAYLSVDSQFSPKEISIEINRAFIERYRDRVTIEAALTVDKARPFPNPAALDGDLHFSGRAPQVGLPTVAEIANAASERPAVELVKAAAGSGKPLGIAGVWRIWPEHAGRSVEEQGKSLPPLDTSNPDHVFEIHPVTRAGTIGLLDSFRPVEGFSPQDARKFFETYEKIPCTLKITRRTVSIVTRKGLYDDVEFLMEVASEPQQVVADGRFVIASAHDLKGELVVKRLRTVFAKDTPPERAVRLLQPGARLHVFGIPRVDFAEISRRVRNPTPGEPAKTLPYEIVILGVYPTPTPPPPGGKPGAGSARGW
jgi:hypothetical protein